MTSSDRHDPLVRAAAEELMARHGTERAVAIADERVESETPRSVHRKWWTAVSHALTDMIDESSRAGTW